MNNQQQTHRTRRRQVFLTFGILLVSILTASSVTASPSIESSVSEVNYNTAAPSLANGHEVNAAYDGCLERRPAPAAMIYWTSQPVERLWERICASAEAVALGNRDKSPSTGYIVERIRSTFPFDPSTAVAIAFCESKFKLDAVGPDGHDLGLMQTRWVVHHKLLSRNGITREMLFTLEGNLKAALLIYIERTSFDSNGWNAWTCFMLI